MPKLFEDVNESVDRYKRRAKSCEEKWSKDHKEAIKCLELEEVIAFGLTVYSLLNRLDEIWRLGVHKKKVPHNPKVDEAITKAFQQWLVGSRKLTKVISKFETLRYDVIGTEEFLAACREVEGILTVDEKFFTHEKFLGLASSAIKSHRSGATKELGSITD